MEAIKVYLNNTKVSILFLLIFSEKFKRIKLLKMRPIGNKEITAVDWFEQRLDDLDIEIPFSIYEEAKDIFRQQVIEAGNSCALKQQLHIDKISKMNKSELRRFIEDRQLTFGEEYYNQNFKI